MHLYKFIITAVLFIASGAVSSISAPATEFESLTGEPSLYESIAFKENEKPDPTMFNLGMEGLRQLSESGIVSRKDIITLIDFTKPSTEKRLWVIDLESKQVKYHTLVAHGRNSGELYATRFSNQPNSYQSSVGLFVTGATYNGKHGISLKLHGLQKGINDLAEQRAIVMHGADYVSSDFITRMGRLGRSYGCPAIPMNVHEALISQVADGSCLFVYYSKAEENAG